MSFGLAAANGGFVDFPFRLVATDLDGTLLTSDNTVSPRTREALAMVAARGAAHLVVTGRSVPWTRHILDELGYTGLAVCGQGAQVYDAGRHRLLTSLTLDRKLAGIALEKIAAEIGPVAIAASRDGLDGEVLLGPGFQPIGLLPTVQVTNLEELWAAPLNKLYLQHPEYSDDELAQLCQALVGDMVGVVMAGEGVVELLPPGLTKARGLAIAGRRLGVRGPEAIAFGDMPNDVPMFGWAGRGVAMANAHPELLAAADEVTTSHDEDGIALVLERLLRS